jgi:hypothetical protein
VAEGGEIEGADGAQKIDAPLRHEQARRAAGGAQDEALGEQLPNQAATRRANRRADRDFSRTHGSARQQQVRDVRAGNQEDERHRAGQHQQRAA